MKKLLFLVFVFFSFLSCSSQKKRPLIGETPYQLNLNALFKDASKSPLKKKDLQNFKGLDFFPLDSSYVVTAQLTFTPKAPTFEMKTTTFRRVLYKSFAIANFNFEGKNYKLTIYKSQDYETDKDELFLPFTDDTSGDESYGGGRYMDLHISDIFNNNKIILDFNNTYNPYCAYNERYSCPITPKKNHLNIPIKAGVKTFKKH